jgi:endonuclease-3 related protein
MSASSSNKILPVVHLLRRKYGEITWWRGSTEEVMIWAILTQQTHWENVEKALLQLRQESLCSLAAIYKADRTDLERAIFCTGFYRIKAMRLKSLASHIIEGYGSIECMAQQTTDQLRKNLLGVSGIGEETADSILCYGFSRPTFVVDTYTERICQCGGISARRPVLKTLFENALPRDTPVYQQVHAYMVEYAKEYCGKKRCNECTIPTLNG